jgi:hypothetical protein
MLGLMGGLVFVSVMDDFTGTLEVLHKTTMGQGVDLGLRCLVWNGKNEVSGVFDFRLSIVLAYKIEITAAGRINVVDHAACLSRVGLSCLSAIPVIPDTG